MTRIEEVVRIGGRNSSKQCVCALKMIKYSTEYMKGIANRHSKSEGGQRQYQHQ